MLIILGTTVLNVKTVLGMSLSYEPNTKRTEVSSKLFGLFKTFKDEEVPNWTLNIKYVCGGSGDTLIHTSKCGVRKPLEDRARSFIDQVKSLDAALINQAFEDAFFKE